MSFADVHVRSKVFGSASPPAKLAALVDSFCCSASPEFLILLFPSAGMSGSRREAGEDLLALSVDADPIADLLDGVRRGAALISLHRPKCKTITPPALITRSKFKYRMPCRETHSWAGILIEKVRRLSRGGCELMRLALRDGQHVSS